MSAMPNTFDRIEPQQRRFEALRIPTGKVEAGRPRSGFGPLCPPVGRCMWSERRGGGAVTVGLTQRWIFFSGLSLYLDFNWM